MTGLTEKVAGPVRQVPCPQCGIKPRTMRLGVSRIVEDTPTVRDFRFGLERHEDFHFVPGQFVTLTADVPGHGPVTRSYSIASAPTQRGCFDLCIKLFPDGKLSRFMFDHVTPGFVFTVKGPFGKFVWSEVLGTRLALIASGTGIAPIASMIRYARDRELDVDAGLLFSNRTAEEVIYGAELDRLAREMPAFRVHHAITRGSPPGWTGFARRIDRAMLEEAFPDVRDRACYLCGNPEMVTATVEHLRALGVPDERIHTEQYY